MYWLERNECIDFDLIGFVFRPFLTEMVHYSDIHSLREKHVVYVDHLVVMTLPQYTWGIDEIHVYLGTPSSQPLHNFEAFVEHNDLRPMHGATVSWRYHCIIAVGYNRLAGVYLSLVESMFPSPYIFRDHLSFPGILRSPLINDYPPIHTLASTCVSCVESHATCKRGEGVSCLNCSSMCKFSGDEDAARTLKCYKAVAAATSTLCPPFQHLIQCAKAAGKFNGQPRMSTELRGRLKSLVQEAYAGAVYEVGGVIREIADSFQEVRVEMGTLSITRSHQMEGVFGFQGGGRLHLRITPHFGIAAYYGAYSLMDCALSHPDKVFCFEGSLMYREGFRVGRVYLNASILTESDIRFTVGWRFKN